MILRPRDSLVGPTLILSSFFFYWLPFRALAQQNHQSEVGHPYIRNFTSKDFHAPETTLATVRDRRGVVYVGNPVGVLEFDGVSWRLIPTPLRTYVRSLDMDASGRVYAGSAGDFGYLSPDEKGKMAFVSLLEKVPKDDRDNFNDIWKTVCTPEGVYFQSYNRLFRWSNGEMKVWKPQVRFGFTSYVRGQLYVSDASVGLLRMQGDALVSVPGFERFRDSRQLILTPYGQDKILVADRGPADPKLVFDTPLTLYDGSSLQRFDTDAAVFLTQHKITAAAALEEGTKFALGTTGGGLIILDQQGHLLWEVNPSTGLQDDTVLSIFRDRDGLWLNLSKGLAKVVVPPPLSIYGMESGIDGAKLAIVRHNGSLYVMTTTGVFRLEAGSPRMPHFVRIAGTADVGVMALASVDDGSRPPRLLLGSTSGLFEIKGDAAFPVIPHTGAQPFSVTALTVSGRDRSRVYVGLDDGLASIQLRLGQVTLEGRFDNVPYSRIVRIVERMNGQVWLGTKIDGVMRLDPGKLGRDVMPARSAALQHFGVSSGLPSGGINVYTAGDQLIFATDDLMQLFSFNESTGRFLPDETFAYAGADPAMRGFGFQEDSRGNIWTHRGRDLVFLERQANGSYARKNLPFAQTADYGATDVAYPEADGVTWFGASGAILRYDAALLKPNPPAFSTLIRRVRSKKFGEIFGGTGDPRELELDPSDNNLTIEFGAPAYARRYAQDFQDYLEGLDKEWSEWTNDPSQDFTNLPAGNFRFHVRSRDLAGNIAREAVFAFRIKRHWYRTWWAYASYWLFFVAALFAVERRQHHRLVSRERELASVRRTEELEAEVKKRTIEIRQQAAEIAGQKDDLQRAYETVESLSEIGKEITSSLDLDTVLFRLYENVSKLMDTSVFGVGIHIPEEHKIEFRLAIRNGQRRKHYERDTRDKNQFAVWCIENRKPVVMNDSEIEYSRYLDRIDTPGARLEDGTLSASIVYLPLIHRDRVLGVMTVQSYRKGAYSEDDVSLLLSLGAYTSIALDNATAYRRLNEQEREVYQRAAELATVNAIGQAAASKLEVKSLIEMVGEKVREVFQAQVAYVALLDKATRMIHFPYGFGAEFPPEPVGRGMTSRVLVSGEPLLTGEDTADDLPIKIVQAAPGAGSCLSVPITAGGETVGVIGVESSDAAKQYGQGDLRLLTTIAATVGVALHNARLFEETAQARVVAEEADAAKSSFLSTVSHELRTPLTSVLGFAKIIRRRLTEKLFPLIPLGDSKTAQIVQEVTQDLEVVLSEGGRLTKLIDNLLDLAKIEAGMVDWRMEQLTAAEIVDRAMAATSSLFESKPVTLAADVAPELPSFTGDRDRLIQVVINLISNALKFTELGSVTCRARLADAEVVISVVDTGLGIAAADQPKVFEKFKQVGNPLTAKPKGTGLGLPICKDIVEHHGGRIWVESSPAGGSTFSFSLPVDATVRALNPALDLEPLMKRLRNPLNGVDRPANASILVVDDDPNIRELLRQEFEECGHQVRLASNGREAVASVRKEKPGLVVLDVMMPEMNGFDVAAVLKNDPETMSIPIIMLTIVRDQERGYHLGVDRYLTKPVDTELLFREVDALMQHGASKKKVMVVDEDSSTLSTLVEALQLRGYHVVETTGLDLVPKALSVKPDVIILNSVLPSKEEIMQTLRLEKGLENVLFLIYQ